MPRSPDRRAGGPSRQGEARRPATAAVRRCVITAIAPAGATRHHRATRPALTLLRLAGAPCLRGEAAELEVGVDAEGVVRYLATTCPDDGAHRAVRLEAATDDESRRPACDEFLTTAREILAGRVQWVPLRFPPSFHAAALAARIRRGTHAARRTPSDATPTWHRAALEHLRRRHPDRDVVIDAASGRHKLHRDARGALVLAVVYLEAFLTEYQRADDPGVVVRYDRVSITASRRRNADWHIQERTVSFTRFSTRFGPEGPLNATEVP